MLVLAQNREITLYRQTCRDDPLARERREIGTYRWAPQPRSAGIMPRPACSMRTVLWPEVEKLVFALSRERGARQKHGRREPVHASFL